MNVMLYEPSDGVLSCAQMALMCVGAQYGATSQVSCSPPGHAVVLYIPRADELDGTAQ